MAVVRTTVRDVERKKEYLRSLEEIELNESRPAPHSLDECVNLKKVVIDKNVKEIPDDLFEHCHKLSQVEVDLMNVRYTQAGDYVVTNQLKLVLCVGVPQIVDGIRRASLSAFVREEVEDFYIGKDFEGFDGRQRRFRIKNIILNPENPYFELEGNCLFEKGTDKLVLGCDGSQIPARTKTIDSCAFYHCGFEKFTIPGNVTRVESSAFEACSALKELVIEEGVKEIGYCSFYGTGIESLDLPASVVSLGESAFGGCKNLKTIVSLGRLKELSEAVFCRSGFETLTVPPQIKKIGDRAFEWSPDLKEVVLPDGVESVGKDAFACCPKLSRVTMADSVKTLGKGAFRNCEKLTDIRLSGSLTDIPEDCFFQCKALEKIDLPAKVAEIGHDAFYFCGRLASIDVSKVKKYPKDAFAGCRKIAEQVNPKKPFKAPDPLFSNDTFYELKEKTQPGESMVFVSDTLSDYIAKFRGVKTHEGHNYIVADKKGTEFFIEITDETSKDKIFELYENPFYICKIVSEGVLYDAIKSAAK